MSQVSPDPEMTSFESALRGLAPSQSRLDRDRLMFEAGARSVHATSRRRWAWPAVAALLTGVIISESVALAVRPEVRVVLQAPSSSVLEKPGIQPEPVVILSQSPEPRMAAALVMPPTDNEAVRMRRQVLQFGLEGLPELPPMLSQSRVTPSPGAGNDASRPLYRYELNKVLDLGGPS
jgi:hypothetical protein